MAREIGWLIERTGARGAAEWLRVLLYPSSTHIGTSVVWADDANLSLRFARREDAEAFMALNPSLCVLARATEHVWCDMPRAPFCDDQSCVLRNERPHGHAQGAPSTTGDR